MYCYYYYSVYCRKNIVLGGRFGGSGRSCRHGSVRCNRSATEVCRDHAVEGYVVHEGQIDISLSCTVTLLPVEDEESMRTRSFVSLCLFAGALLSADAYSGGLSEQQNSLHPLSGVEIADEFHGLGHFEFLEEFEEPAKGSLAPAAKPSPKRLQCSCSFKKANMQPTSFIETLTSRNLRAGR